LHLLLFARILHLDNQMRWAETDKFSDFTDKTLKVYYEDPSTSSNKQ